MDLPKYDWHSLNGMANQWVLKSSLVDQYKILESEQKLYQIYPYSCFCHHLNHVNVALNSVLARVGLNLLWGKAQLYLLFSLASTSNILRILCVSPLLRFPCKQKGRLLSLGILKNESIYSDQTRALKGTLLLDTWRKKQWTICSRQWIWYTTQSSPLA